MERSTNKSPQSHAGRSVPGLPALGEDQSEGISTAVRSPPDDLGTHYPAVVLEWLRKYDIGVTDLIKHHVKWSPSREQLVYLFHGEGTDVVLWQARNFREGTGHKNRFFTGGKPEEVIAYYHPEQETRTGVIVEDCVSGIKCARSGFSGIPCFGATMSKQKLTRLARVFRTIVVWLDEDKMNQGRQLATHLALLGVTTKVLWTEKDPKEYPEDFIRSHVNVPV